MNAGSTAFKFVVVIACCIMIGLSIAYMTGYMDGSDSYVGYLIEKTLRRISNFLM